MFSILLNCRIDGNSDSKLSALLDSLKQYSQDMSQFEVLIKFDADDSKAMDAIKTFPSYPFPIKHMVDRRGRGPGDFHLGYTTLLQIANVSSECFITLADDFVATPNWDAIVNEGLITRGSLGFVYENWILERLSGTEDVFIIQHQLHPNGTPENKFNTDWNYYDIDNLGFETTPIFSAKLIQLCGGFGHVAFTDAWAILLQHELKNSHGVDISRFVDKPYAIRQQQALGMDVVEQANREGQRIQTFRLMKSAWYRGIIETQAQVVADYHNKYRRDLLDKNFLDTVTRIDPKFAYTRNEHGKANTNNK